MNINFSIKPRKVLGFGVVVQEEDGTRTLIFSDDVDAGLVHMNMQGHGIHGDDNIVNFSAHQIRYEISLYGTSFSMMRGVDRGMGELLQLEDHSSDKEFPPSRSGKLEGFQRHSKTIEDKSRNIQKKRKPLRAKWR